MLCRSRWILVVFTLAFAACSGRTKLAGPVDGSAGDSPSADLAEGTANIMVSQTTVDFGVIDVGATSPPVVITVTNTGTATSGPLSVLVTGTGITAVGCEGTTLAPQATCNISVTINQTRAARISGTVEVGDNPGNTKKITVTVIAITPGMIFALSPSPLDLGSVLMGKSVSGTIVMTNPSFFDMTGVGIAVSGAGFGLSPTGTCTGTLGTEQSCNIVVSFTAGTTAGPAKGLVTVSQGGLIKPVQVTATVVSGEAPFRMTPSTASFKTVVGTPSSPATFYVTGDLGSTGLTVTITGTNTDDFSFTTDCDQPFAPGVANTCQVAVVYNPKVAPTTSSTATLRVAEPGNGASAIATLSGTTVPASTPTLPWDQARIGDMGTGWWMNAQKGKFFISTRLRITDATDRTGRAQAINITEIVTNKSGSTALSLVPLPSELPGKWIYDPEMGMTAAGPMVATTFDEATKYINGGADPFYNSTKGYSAKVFAWANYRETPGDAAYYLDLRIWEMASPADAASLYSDLLQNALYSPDNVPWKTCQGVAGNPCP
jgi:hypothetical protein